jgi:hypothetical protein
LEQKTFWLLVLKNIAYTLLVLLCYIAQETPALPFSPGPRPVAVIAAVSALAMNEGEFSGGLFGLFGGILCDTAAFHIFGVASIFFLVLGCAVGLLVLYLMQPNLHSALLLTGGFALIYGLAAHYLIYGMWGYAGAGRMVLLRTIPSAVGTALLGCVLFLLVRRIRDGFEEAIRG